MCRDGGGPGDVLLQAGRHSGQSGRRGRQAPLGRGRPSAGHTYIPTLQVGQSFLSLFKIHIHGCIFHGLF